MPEKDFCKYADMFGWDTPWDVPLKDIAGAVLGCNSPKIFAFTGDPEPDNPWAIIGTKTKEEAVNFLMHRMHPDVTDPDKIEDIMEELRDQVEPWGG